ncbi:MAG: uncharacterized protein A8A55_0257 [Amphiamblys sp. WSBS2006]|nr:MAG: uncharacterized protein A8A55_0257 [Amphiamblys sp. WSBS2006]
MSGREEKDCLVYAYTNAILRRKRKENQDRMLRQLEENMLIIKTQTETLQKMKRVLFYLSQEKERETTQKVFEQEENELVVLSKLSELKAKLETALSTQRIIGVKKNITEETIQQIDLDGEKIKEAIRHRREIDGYKQKTKEHEIAERKERIRFKKERLKTYNIVDGTG